MAVAGVVADGTALLLLFALTTREAGLGEEAPGLPTVTLFAAVAAGVAVVGVAIAAVAAVLLLNAPSTCGKMLLTKDASLQRKSVISPNDLKRCAC